MTSGVYKRIEGKKYGSFFKGQIAWNKGMKGVNGPSRKGKKYPEKQGENAYQWIKDKTQLKKDLERGSYAHIYWSKSIKKRDGLKCKINNQDCKGRLEAHHILGYTEHPELRYELNNGIALCHFHHPRKRAEEAKLSPFFQQLVSEK